MTNVLQGQNIEDENSHTCAQYSKSAHTPEPGQCGWVGSTLGWAPAGSPLWRQRVKSQEPAWGWGEAVTVPSEAQI